MPQNRILEVTSICYVRTDICCVCVDLRRIKGLNKFPGQMEQPRQQPGWIRTETKDRVFHASREMSNSTMPETYLEPCQEEHGNHAGKLSFGLKIKRQD